MNTTRIARLPEKCAVKTKAEGNNGVRVASICHPMSRRDRHGMEVYRKSSVITRVLVKLNWGDFIEMRLWVRIYEYALGRFCNIVSSRCIELYEYMY